MTEPAAVAIILPMNIALVAALAALALAVQHNGRAAVIGWYTNMQIVP